MHQKASTGKAGDDVISGLVFLSFNGQRIFPCKRRQCDLTFFSLQIAAQGVAEKTFGGTGQTLKEVICVRRDCVNTTCEIRGTGELLKKDESPRFFLLFSS